MGLVVKDDGWRVPDWLWAEIEPLLPERPAHPLGCRNPRLPGPDAMNAMTKATARWRPYRAESH